METDNKFTEGPILKPLLQFTIPILLALFLQAMYGAVDVIVVGQFSDASGVSAVATGSQIMQIITGLITGLTMGTTVLLGQKIGERNASSAARTIGAAICLFTVIAVFLTILMLFCARSFARLVHAPAESFETTVSYVLICSCGIVFIVAYNVISGLFRGMGNSRLPLIFVAIACLTNIVGNLLFVGAFHWGPNGSAASTVLSQAVSVLLSLVIIRRNGLPFAFSRTNIGFHRTETLKMLQLGAPISLQDALTDLSFLIITAILNEHGLIVSAAIGVSEKLIIFIMLVPIAFMSAISAFSAQNIGAGLPDRAKKCLKYGIITSLTIGIGLFVMAILNGDTFASIFSNDVNVIAASSEYMKSYATDCILVSVLFCFMGYYNGCGKTTFVMIQGIMAAFLVRIPYCYFMSKSVHFSMFLTGFASPLATGLSVIVSAAYFIHISRKNAQEISF